MSDNREIFLPNVLLFAGKIVISQPKKGGEKLGRGENQKYYF